MSSTIMEDIDVSSSGDVIESIPDCSRGYPPGSEFPKRVNQLSHSKTTVVSRSYPKHRLSGVTLVGQGGAPTRATTATTASPSLPLPKFLGELFTISDSHADDNPRSRRLGHLVNGVQDRVQAMQRATVADRALSDR